MKMGRSLSNRWVINSWVSHNQHSNCIIIIYTLHLFNSMIITYLNLVFLLLSLMKYRMILIKIWEDRTILTLIYLAILLFLCQWMGKRNRLLLIRPMLIGNNHQNNSWLRVRRFRDNRKYKGWIPNSWKEEN